MIKYKYCVLGICTINCLYSICEFANMKAYDGPETEYMWMGLYVVNVILNVLVLVRFYYADRYPVLIWFAYTVPLFLIRLTCTPYNRLSRLYVLLCGIVDAYIFVTFFVMGAAYKNLANSAPRERTTIHSAQAQVDRHPGRGVQFINLPSSTHYKQSHSPYETDIPSAPVFIEESKI